MGKTMPKIVPRAASRVCTFMAAKSRDLEPYDYFPLVCRMTRAPIPAKG